MLDQQIRFVYEHFVDDIKKIECDCEIKILKNRNSTKPINQWLLDSEAKFDERIIKDLHVVCNGPTTTGKIEKLQTNKRKLITEKLSKNEHLNEKYDFVNFAVVNNPADLTAKTKLIKPQEEIKKTKPNQNDNSYCFEVDRGPDNEEKNQKPKISICSSCNYYNEYIPFDPNYKCYKCKKGL